MKKLTVLTSLLLTRFCLAGCDCTIVPFKPDLPCFNECVGKILAQASYGELTGKYGLPRDIADSIISARAHGSTTSSDWYKNALGGSEAWTVDAIFRKKEQSADDNPKK